MNKKKIVQLAIKSYIGKFLDGKRVSAISSFFSRSDLKKYISTLKNLENNKTLIISCPTNNNFDITAFEKLFPNKRIVLKKDPSLLLGIQIVNNDIVYEYSLKNSLDNMISHIEKSYD